MVKFFQAKVFHKRITPENVFCYTAGYILLPLLGKLKNPWFFSIDRFNIFSFHNKDHATRKPTPILPWVWEKLAQGKIQENSISQIVLLTHPRCFGFVFNPVSFYFCLNENQHPLAIIAEVNNTFGQTHSYIIHEENLAEIIPNKIYKAQKEFFVSPFFEREGHYQFRFNYTPTKIAVFVDYFKDSKLAFETSLTGSAKEFTFQNAIFYSLTTFKTVILIGFQAIILKFIKKLKFRFPPTKLQNSTTLNKL